jgi:REP-associated tyrosine transposase
MGKVLRLQVAGGTFHVTTRGNRGQPIFTDSRDRERFMEMTSAVIAAAGWQCRAYCLMSNHYHLLIETPEPNLSAGMLRLNGWYARWFNRRHDVEGHLFGRRFSSTFVESEAHLLEAWRYVLLNPVRALLCRDPGNWPWSSYLATIGWIPAPTFLAVDELLRLFDADLGVARPAFARFVDAEVAVVQERRVA